MTADVIVSEALVNKSHSEEEMAPYDANMNSEKSDFDSVSQDIAKSMMTLLLPHAIPLLKKTRRKKKKTVMPSENLSSTPKPHEDQSKFGSSEHNKPVVLQKFDDDQCVINKLILPSNNVEANQPSLDKNKNAYLPNGGELFVGGDVVSPWFLDAETNGNGDVLHDDKLQVNLSKRPQDGHVCLPESILGCMPANKKVLSEVNQDFCNNVDENSLSANINSEKVLKNSSDYNEGKNH